ncbi:MAG: hypothetical protein K2L54_04395 [Clostridiales bacterium]|nr:hypothetical protein [Clostridiales bacterium]
MRSAERKVIENIILINPLIYGLAENIEREQERVIADMTSPADKVVKKLYDLDNRRIDLCNLKVLYGFIEDGLGEKFELLRSCVFGGATCGLYSLAARQLERAGYTVERAEKEFEYLFKTIKRRRAVKRYAPKFKVVDMFGGATVN